MRASCRYAGRAGDPPQGASMRIPTACRTGAWSAACADRPVSGMRPTDGPQFPAAGSPTGVAPSPAEGTDAGAAKPPDAGCRTDRHQHRIPDRALLASGPDAIAAPHGPVDREGPVRAPADWCRFKRLPRDWQARRNRTESGGVQAPVRPCCGPSFPLRARTRILDRGICRVQGPYFASGQNRSRVGRPIPDTSAPFRPCARLGRCAHRRDSKSP